MSDGGGRLRYKQALRDPYRRAQRSSQSRAKTVPSHSSAGGCAMLFNGAALVGGAILGYVQGGPGGAAIGAGAGIATAGAFTAMLGL